MRYRKTLKELDSDLQLIEEKYSKENQGQRSVDFGADNKKAVTRMDFLPDKVLKKIAKEKDVNEEEADLNEKKKRKKQKASDIPGYRRGRSKKQLKKLDRVTKRASSGKFTSADYEREDKRRQRELPKGAQTPKNPFTGKIAVGESKDLEEIKSLIEEVIKQELEEKKKRKKKKKKKAKRKTLSKKTMATLRKKAKSSGYTAGSLASEYRKGLGAFYTSGSRKGMGAHQWAMARVNSAIGKGNPSWANLKRSKAKK